MEKQERNTLLIRNNEKKGKLINCSVFVDISTKAVAAGLSLSLYTRCFDCAWPQNKLIKFAVFAL